MVNFNMRMYSSGTSYTAYAIVGIMTNLPHALFSSWATEEGLILGSPGDYGVGMFFLPEDEVGVRNICRIFEQLAGAEQLPVIGWRDVVADSGCRTRM